MELFCTNTVQKKLSMRSQFNYAAQFKNKSDLGFNT